MIDKQCKPCVFNGSHIKLACQLTKFCGKPIAAKEVKPMAKGSCEGKGMGKGMGKDMPKTGKKK